MQEAAFQNQTHTDPTVIGRRAVFTGLIPYLQGEDLYIALWLWQEKYATTTAASPHHFINELACLVTKSVRNCDLHRSIVTAMGKQLFELAPDPYPDMVAYREQRQPTDKRAFHTTESMIEPVASTVVFESLLRSVFQQLDEESDTAAEKLRRYLSHHLASIGLEVDAFSEIAQWLNGLRAHLSHAYTDAQMRALVHVVYVGGCEYLGPMHIDTLLARAIDAAEHLPQATYSPPRRLL